MKIGVQGIVLLVALFILTAGVAVVVYSQTNTTHAPENPFVGLQARDYVDEREEWSERIDDVGAAQAYDDFITTYQNLSYGEQHSLAHVFGDLLYEKEGISGVSICDQSFSFGCYHSFFGRAIIENGLPVIHDLDEACIDAYGLKGLGCPHGIGHGILSYVGHDNLTEALEACATLTWKGPIGGCTGGVFMEFNFLTMQSSSGVGRREPKEGNLHYPCTDIPEHFRQACYFAQGTWWSRVYSSDHGRVDGYERAGELCAEVETTSGREACFRGLGNIIAGRAEYDASAIGAKCTDMPSTEAEVLCRQGAAWNMSSLPPYRDSWRSICEDLSGESRKICLAGETLI